MNLADPSETEPQPAAAVEALFVLLAPMLPDDSEPLTPAILIVDAHPATRLGLRGLLTGLVPSTVVLDSPDVESALQLTANIELALAIVGTTTHPRPPLSELASIRRAHARVRTLLLAAVADPAWVQQALKAGTDGFALKSSATDELRLAVDAVLNGQKYVDPGLRLDPPRLPRHHALSARENEVIRLFAAGEPTKSIAQLLGISPRTLETYRARAMTKLGLRTRADLIRHALRSGWLPNC